MRSMIKSAVSTAARTQKGKKLPQNRSQIPIS